MEKRRALSGVPTTSIMLRSSYPKAGGGSPRTCRSILHEASPRPLVAMRVTCEALVGVEGTPRIDPMAPRSAVAT